MLLISAIFIYLSCIGIELPYVGPNATNFNDYSLIAKNYNLFGFLPTKFAQIVSVSQSLPTHPQYYLHHPPLLSIIQALFMRLAGYDFWIGRLPVIIFSFASLILIYQISRQLSGKNHALLAALTFTLIPATTLFGKMIGQEALVLFFSLLATFSVLKYLKNKSKKFLTLTIISIILGTLSDWPMTYFTAFLAIFLFSKKQPKTALILLSAATATAALFLLYIHIIMSGFSDLASAITTRSLGQLLHQSFWPLRWFSIILLRFIIYFNPVFIIFSFYFILKNIIAKNRGTLFFVNLIYLAFGTTHILLYPEGSFGHPYWIYYLAPAVSLSSASVLLQLSKHHKISAAAIIILSLIFMITIQYWKLQQTKSNLWRYSLAQKINPYLKPYEPVMINTNSAIDSDLLNYAFSRPTATISKSSQINNNFKHFLFSCPSACGPDPLLLYLKANHPSHFFIQSNANAYLFDLTIRKKSPSEKIKPANPASHQNAANPESFFKKSYRILKQIINAPQI